MADVIDNLKILFHGEVQLLDFGESRTAGKFIKLRLSDLDNDGDPLAPFRGMDTPSLKRTGHIMNITLSDGDIIPAEAKPEKGPYGKEASKLYSSGFFLAPAVWKALGTDEEYRSWIQRQPCICCGNQDWVEKLGEGRCEAAHVLRAEAAPSREGQTPDKPAYSCVPLCNKHHALQHRGGETAVFLEHDLLKTGKDAGELKAENLEGKAKDWFFRRKLCLLETWAHDRLCKALGVESLTFLDPDALIVWVVEAQVDNYLPRNYGGEV